MKKKYTHVIVGGGEVGNGLKAVIGGKIHDPKKCIFAIGCFDVLHICIPYDDHFVFHVNRYKEMFSPKYTIIHSTVPVGTCKLLKATHSPIRGVHPHIAKGIRTFVKFVGGMNAVAVSKILNSYGIKTITTAKSENTEAMKLWDTTQYGFNIILNRMIYKWCKEFNVDFDIAYTLANKTYNEGYSKLGRHEVVRPYLKYTKGKIGGHCVRQNARLLSRKIADELEKSE